MNTRELIDHLDAKMKNEEILLEEPKGMRIKINEKDSRGQLKIRRNTFLFEERERIYRLRKSFKKNPPVVLDNVVYTVSQFKWDTIGIDYVAAFINAKIGVNIQDIQNKKSRIEPIYVSYKGCPISVKALLDMDINVQDKHDATVLMLGAANNHFLLIRDLIHFGAQVDIQDKNGQTALMYAAVNGSAASAKVLTDDAKADVNIQDKQGKTALMYVVAKNNIAVKVLIKMLVDEKADVNIQNKNNETALMYAVLNGNVDAVQLLIDAKAEMNIQDKNGQTALMYAVTNGEFASVKALIDAKAEVNIQGKNGKTALMWAAYKGNASSVKTLLAAKADVSIEYKQGFTVFDVVRTTECKNLIDEVMPKWYSSLFTCVQLVPDHQPTVEHSIIKKNVL